MNTKPEPLFNVNIDVINETETPIHNPKPKGYNLKQENLIQKWKTKKLQADNLPLETLNPNQGS